MKNKFLRKRKYKDLIYITLKFMMRHKEANQTKNSRSLSSNKKKTCKSTMMNILG